MFDLLSSFAVVLDEKIYLILSSTFCTYVESASRSYSMSIHNEIDIISLEDQKLFSIQEYIHF